MDNRHIEFRTIISNLQNAQESRIQIDEALRDNNPNLNINDNQAHEQNNNNNNDFPNNNDNFNFEQPSNIINQMRTFNNGFLVRAGQYLCSSCNYTCGIIIKFIWYYFFAVYTSSEYYYGDGEHCVSLLIEGQSLKSYYYYNMIFSFLALILTLCERENNGNRRACMGCAQVILFITFISLFVRTQSAMMKGENCGDLKFFIKIWLFFCYLEFGSCCLIFFCICCVVCIVSICKGNRGGDDAQQEQNVI
jgi:hypothetical protein